MFLAGTLGRLLAKDRLISGLLLSYLGIGLTVFILLCKILLNPPLSGIFGFLSCLYSTSLGCKYVSIKTEWTLKRSLIPLTISNPSLDLISTSIGNLRVKRHEVAGCYLLYISAYFHHKIGYILLGFKRIIYKMLI